MIQPLINQAITTAGFVAVRLPINAGCTSFSVWTEDGNAFLLATDAAGTDAITVPDGLALNFEHTERKTAGAAGEDGSLLFYAKATVNGDLSGIIAKG